MKCVVCGCIRAEHEALEQVVERLRSEKSSLQSRLDRALGEVSELMRANHAMHEKICSPEQPKEK